jgi:hypothetical protein
MPNWCSNTFTIKGDVESLRPLWEATQQEDNPQFLEAIAPIGEWEYGNAVEAWGTKWDVNTDGMEFEDHGDGTATLHGWFDSAWSPPIEAFNTLAGDLDSCYIELYYFEPGMAFVGYWSSEGGDDHYDIDPDAEDMGIPEYLEEHFNVADWFDSGEACYEEELELKE